MSLLEFSGLLIKRIKSNFVAVIYVQYFIKARNFGVFVTYNSGENQDNLNAFLIFRKILRPLLEISRLFTKIINKNFV